jgi:ABC-type lipoprotein export system ATPase subunit
MTTVSTFDAGLAVRCEQVRHVYRVGTRELVALDRVELATQPGEGVAIVGASGSGKSTLLSLLAGLLRPSSGQLFVGGDDIAIMTERELLGYRGQRVGIVLQNPPRNLLTYGTGIDNVDFARTGARRYQRAKLLEPSKLLRSLGLADLGAQRVSRLSGGEQQRLSVAVAMARGPGLLLADEPTSQLDRANRDRVVELLRTVSARFGTTVIMVTHDQELASALGRTVTIADGRADDHENRTRQLSRVGADGLIRLPDDVQTVLPAGSRVRIVRKPQGAEIIRVDEEGIDD